MLFVVALQTLSLIHILPVTLAADPADAAAQHVVPYHTGAAAYYTAQGITPATPESAREVADE